MTENELKSKLLECEAMGESDYAAGYRRGLRRHYHGEKFGTPEEHAQMQSLLFDQDASRLEIGRGYDDGLAGKRPDWGKP